MHTLLQQYNSIRDYVVPVLKESKFKEHGRITPEEFVAAGDFLVYKFPVWSWEKGESSKAKDYLPADKQYLVTRGVPCLRRAHSLAYTDDDAEKMLSFGDEGKEEEWVQTHAGRTVKPRPEVITEIPDDLEGSPKMPTKELGDLSLSGGPGDTTLGTIPDMDEIPDMEEEDEATAVNIGKVVTHDAAGVTPRKDNLLQVRTYDVMITYDKYYQTPKFWLLGYDENRTPLTAEQIFQDVSSEHAHKTVTIDPFPHSTTLRIASVHPCKHADVMKSFIQRMNNTVLNSQKIGSGSGSGSGVTSPTRDGKDKEKKRTWLTRKLTGGGSGSASGSSSPGKDKAVAEAEDGEGEGMRVDFYLVVFLKFIASIVPTIEVDSTTAL